MKRTKHFKSTEVHVLHNEEFKEKGGKEWILNTVFGSNYLKVSNQKKEAFIKEQSNYGYQMLYVSSILYLSFFLFLCFFIFLVLPFFFYTFFHVLSPCVSSDTLMLSLFHNFFRACTFCLLTSYKTSKNN